MSWEKHAWSNTSFPDHNSPDTARYDTNLDIKTSFCSHGSRQTKSTDIVLAVSQHKRQLLSILGIMNAKPILNAQCHVPVHKLYCTFKIPYIKDQHCSHDVGTMSTMWVCCQYDVYVVGTMWVRCCHHGNEVVMVTAVRFWGAFPKTVRTIAFCRLITKPCSTMQQPNYECFPKISS